MNQPTDILAPIAPPDPARSTMRDRQIFMARHTRPWARAMALEDTLDPPPPDPPLPELPIPGDPMPDQLAAVWDRMAPLEHKLIKGGVIWRAPPEQHWNRIAVCIDIFRAYDLMCREAVQMCRFDDGLGAHMPQHAEMLVRLWRARAPDQQPPDWRWQAHLEAVMGFGALCRASSAEIATVATAEWNAAKRRSHDFLETLRRRLWPMCRGQLPEETILSATDELQQDWGVFLPDELLLPLLNQIDTAAAPRWRPRRRA